MQILYLAELISVIPYLGFEMVLATFLKSGDKLSLLVLWAEVNVLAECILFKIILTMFIMVIIVMEVIVQIIITPGLVLQI